MSEPPTKTQAFFKGGFGCLLLFLAVGFLAVIFGGRLRIDIFGVLLLLIIGGIFGLIIRAVYNRGRRDGSGDA